MNFFNVQIIHFFNLVTVFGIFFNWLNVFLFDRLFKFQPEQVLHPILVIDGKPDLIDTFKYKSKLSQLQGIRAFRPASK